MRGNPIRYLVVVMFSLIIGLWNFGCTRKIEGDKAQQSYSIGFVLGQQLSKVKDDLDHDMVARGLKDGIASDSKLSKDTLDRRVSELQTKQRDREALSAADNLKKSQGFITTIASKAGVVKLAEGVFVEKVKTAQGSRNALKDDDEISIAYVAKLADGNIVDQTSGAEGVKIRYRDLLMPGLKRVVSEMPIGSEWIVYLSPDQAFGASTRPGVPSQSALVYDLKLLSIQRQK